MVAYLGSKDFCRLQDSTTEGLEAGSSGRSRRGWSHSWDLSTSADYKMQLLKDLKQVAVFVSYRQEEPTWTGSDYRGTTTGSTIGPASVLAKTGCPKQKRV